MLLNILIWDPLAHLYAFLQPCLPAQFNQRLGSGISTRTLPVIIVPPTLSGPHHSECCWVSHQAPAALHLKTSCWPVFQTGQECWEASALRSNLQPVMNGIPPFPCPWERQGGNNLMSVLHTCSKNTLYSLPSLSCLTFIYPYQCFLGSLPKYTACTQILIWGSSEGIQTGQWWIIAFKPGNEIIKYMIEGVGDKRVERQ